MPFISNHNIFRPSSPTPIQRFLTSPTTFLSKWLYTHQPPITAPQPISPRIKVVCISDTHNKQPDIPNGDILIHAGDLTISGTFTELQAQLIWLNTLPHTHKIVIAGNHDVLLDPDYPFHKFNHTTRNQLCWSNLTYLSSSSVALTCHDRTLRIYGSPQTPKYGNWAFQYAHAHAHDVWKDTIPDSTDILVTHGPAKGHVDLTSPATGCKHLLREVGRVKPRLHVCGHVHQARGVEVVDWGVVQWCYERANIEDGGVWVVGIMLVMWALGWVLWMFGKRREGRTVFVNAAVEGNEGEGVIVVDI